MRLPNGYGSVVKMSGNRRRPYAVRKTDGFNEKGYPIYKIIGYTETKEEGLSLLAKYNESPWNINEQKIVLVLRGKKLEDKKRCEGIISGSATMEVCVESYDVNSVSV